MKYNRYMIDTFAISQLREKVPTLSKTILKRKLYALINKRDKLEKHHRVNLPTGAMFNWSINANGTPTVSAVSELDLIKEAILIISDEIAHRAFAKMCSDTDTTRTNKEQE